MSDPQQLERELLEYLEKEPNLRREDRLIYLRSIFNKRSEHASLEHVINSGDLYDIMSRAKSDYSNRSVPVRISRRRLAADELPSISVIESFIGYLNKMHLLKKLVKFDYTEKE